MFDEGRMPTLGHGGVRKPNLAARTGPQGNGLQSRPGSLSWQSYGTQFSSLTNQRRFTETTSQPRESIPKVVHQLGSALLSQN
jgi:hypothetical protein